ncbi:MAG: ABC transporter substrate-binding protein, partial [Alphaproteobacteria bacterium]
MKELDFYTKMLEDGKISRREFMGRAVALGVTVGVATTMAGKAAMAAPKKGGHLRFGVGAGASDDTLDPATYGENFTQWMGFATRNYLTEIDREGKLVGELATGWSATPDAAQWTFELRNDVEFHNGKTMEAEDVIASFNH